MLRLCTLSFFLLCIFSSLAFCFTQDISAKVLSESRQGAIDISDLNRQFKTNRTEETLSYRMENVSDYWSFESRVLISQPDYSSVLIRNKKAEERKLSDESQSRSELASVLSLGFTKGADSASLGWQGHISRSPFATQQLSGSYHRSLYSGVTVFGINGIYLTQSQPQSYFIDRDFRTKERPKNVHAVGGGLELEQILTEQWKAKVVSRLGHRIEERPLSLGAEIQNICALTNSLFLQLGIQYDSELGTQSLKNERGYFKAYGGSARITLEPFYDFLFSLSYALLLERESDPRIGREVQVASDQYGLGISYALHNLNFEVLSSYIVTNTRAQGFTFSGGATWRL